MGDVRAIENLKEMKIILQDQLQNIAEGYISVGFYLKKTRDDKLYLEEGFADVYEFAKSVFNISRTWAVRFMQINDTYSVDGYSPEIQDKYRGYGSSKLSEMLTLPEEIREEVPTSATINEIRDVKKTISETESKYDPQISLCDIAQNAENTESDIDFEDDWMKEVVYEFFKGDGKPCFEPLTKWLASDNACEAIDREIMEIVAPTKFNMFRMKRANVLFSEHKIMVKPYAGNGQQEDFTYTDMGKAFEEMFYAQSVDWNGDMEIAYQYVYNKTLNEKKPEPQQEPPEPPKKEEKTEKLVEKNALGQQDKEKEPDIVNEEQPTNNTEDPEEEQIPAQAEIADYPEFMPEPEEIEESVELDEPEEIEAPGGITGQQVHEITEEVVQEGETVEDVLKSGDLDKIKKLLEEAFRIEESWWKRWYKKVVKL